jgi:hypothetical protein
MTRHIVAESTALLREDFSWMEGRSFLTIVFHEPALWLFGLSGGGNLSTATGTWRVVRDNSVLVSSEDHGHSFGLPAPVDSAAEATAATLNATIRSARLGSGAPDLEIILTNGVRLEVLALSRGYECWQVSDPSGRCVVVHGSGHASAWLQPPVANQSGGPDAV